MKFSEEQLDAIAQWMSGRKHGASTIRSVIATLRQSTSPRAIQKLLNDLGIWLRSAAAQNLADKIPLDQQHARFRRLTRPETDHDGLELPTNIANLMMEDMLNQPTVAEADKLYASWKAIQSKPPKERDHLKKMLFEHYENDTHVGERSRKLTTDLWMPWQGKYRGA